MRHRVREPSWEEVTGFIESHPHGATLDEVGAVWDCTRERIRQIEVRAMRNARRAIARLEREEREAALKGEPA